MIREVIVVEGQADVSAVRRAVEAEVVATGGFRIAAATLELIRSAARRRGIIVLTDPDHAGEQIRRRIADAVADAVGPCRHARIPASRCTRPDGNIGIENASSEAIREALSGARAGTMEPLGTFVLADLVRLGLVGGPSAASRRARVGDRLALGRPTAAQLLRRLNHFGVTEDELRAALAG